MVIKQLKKIEFRELAKTLGTETHKVVRDGEVWFEQLTDGDVAYRYKVLSLESVTLDLLERTALAKDSILPIRLKDRRGRTNALVYFRGSKIFYHIVVTSKAEISSAMNNVLVFGEYIVKTKAAELLIVVPEQQDDTDSTNETNL